ncbi:uncharacterized protein IUM83_03481 [Phytophthora cinnamomi]|uniref:uncharacterized protein n=1 Tax=Phytophthora cinnamomi TaxID=4785 RepID=UPI003559E820|nr:hypothetical protein IUM83_03481 [Phytophthora cinnamomi]
MGDADDAQHNAVKPVFGVDSDIKIMMCFYHVAAKVFEKPSKLHPSLYAAVAKGVHDMHFAVGEAEFLATQTRVLKDWSHLPGLASFSAYFKRQWLQKRCWMWQIYHTPSAFATTNNPVESFNADDHESTTPKPFSVEPLPSKTLMRRAKEMRRTGMLYEGVRDSGSIAFLLNITANDDSTGPEVVRVLSRRVARVYDPETKRSREALPVTSQLGEQTARMEVEGMPELGWAVDTQ